MFKINVADLLASYPGESRELEFSGEIIPGFYEDIAFVAPLAFHIRLVGLDDGVEVIFQNLDTVVEYEGNTREVHLQDVGRTFREVHDPLAPDDIKFIDHKHKTVDLKEVIREEIIIACYY